MPYYPGFAKRFREALTEYGIKTTQVAVGNFFGVSEITARNWLIGEKMPGMKNLIKIAEYTDTCIEWIATGRGPKRPGKMESNIVGRPAKLSDREKILIRKYRRLTSEDQARLDLIIDALELVERKSRVLAKKNTR